VFVQHSWVGCSALLDLSSPPPPRPLCFAQRGVSEAVFGTLPSVFNEVRGKGPTLANSRSFVFCVSQNVSEHLAVLWRNLPEHFLCLFLFEITNFVSPGSFPFKVVKFVL
jgi:hypothetical protein